MYSRSILDSPVVNLDQCSFAFCLVCLFKSWEQTEEGVKTLARPSVCQLGYVAACWGYWHECVCVCVWKWPVSGKASDLYHQSSAGPGMFNCSFFPLCLFLSQALFFHISLSHSSSPSRSHLIHLSLLLFSCLSLHPFTSEPLFHPSALSFLPSLLHRISL